MIGRKSHNQTNDGGMAPQSFDDYAMRLGDMMRGERATLGKSLLDVQRELRIKASYIAAIENCDPSAFDTPGFIAGYVRSYARYLGMDPDEAFAHFCAESGFSVAHGMSNEASTIRKPNEAEVVKPRVRNPLAEPNLPFAPASDSFVSRIEPGAMGSSLVLLALIGGIGYGGWSVLQEVQRVQVTPVEQTPVVLSELDPLSSASLSPSANTPDAQSRDAQASMAGGTPGVANSGAVAGAGVFTPPSSEAYDRLLRPQALDVPVLIARDAPISTLDPESSGLYAGSAHRALPQMQDDPVQRELAAIVGQQPAVPTAVASGLPSLSTDGVTVIAVRPAWVQVKDAGGAVLYSRVMNAGDTYAVPASAAGPMIQVGESGAVYFNVNGQTLGPVGARGAVTSDVSLGAAELTARFSPAEPGTDGDLMTTLVALDLERRPAQQIASIAAPTQNAPAQNTLTQNAPVQLVPTELAENLPAVPPQARPGPLRQDQAVAALEPGAETPSVTAPPALETTTAPVVAALPNPFAADVALSPQVTTSPEPSITVVATSEAWVEVSLASGKTIFAATMQPGETYAVPQTEVPPKIFSGNGGGVYFAVNEQLFGPYGDCYQFGRDLALEAGAITSRMQTADLGQVMSVERLVADLSNNIRPGTCQ